VPDRVGIGADGALADQGADSLRNFDLEVRVFLR
jgi:hypothetical protein